MYGVFDYVVDVCGYIWGVVLEYYDGDWVYCIGCFIQLEEFNGLLFDMCIGCYYGDVFEVEWSYMFVGQLGKLCVMFF